MADVTAAASSAPAGSSGGGLVPAKCVSLVGVLSQDPSDCRFQRMRADADLDITNYDGGDLRARSPVWMRRTNRARYRRPSQLQRPGAARRAATSSSVRKGVCVRVASSGCPPAEDARLQTPTAAAPPSGDPVIGTPIRLTKEAAEPADHSRNTVAATAQPAHLLRSSVIDAVSDQSLCQPRVLLSDVALRYPIDVQPLVCSGSPAVL